MNETKYIDRNKLMERLPVMTVNNGDYLVSTDDVRKAIAISAADTEDVVKVIRCKDCKWFNSVGCAIRIVDDSDNPTENDYCSFGERKNDT